MAMSNIPLDLSAQFNTGDAMAGFMPVSGGAPDTAQGILDPGYNWEDLLNPIGVTANAGSPSMTNSSPDGAQAGAAYEKSNETDTTSSTEPAPPSHPFCSCAASGTCSHCRIKQRVSRVETEYEAVRTTLEKIRNVVNRHDGVLQEVHDGRQVPDSLMGELWRYQDELRAVLASQV